MIQDMPGSGLRREFFDILNSKKPDIISFPEYYFVGPEYQNVPSSLADHDKFIETMAGWSLEFKCIVVGGTVVERDRKALYNRCHVFKDGESIGHYDKIHLFKNEGNGLVRPGHEYAVIQIGDYRLGLLICADVLHADSFANLRGLKPDIVFIPTTSPFRPGEPAGVKFTRDQEIFGHGAAICDSILFKTNACGAIMGHQLQGRSLIASPNKIEWRVEPENEDEPALILASIRGEKQNPSLDIELYRS
jgi:predicted amidohydrolase